MWEEVVEILDRLCLLVLWWGLWSSPLGIIWRGGKPYVNHLNFPFSSQGLAQPSDNLAATVMPKQFPRQSLWEVKPQHGLQLQSSI